VGTKVLHKLNAQTLLLPKLEMTITTACHEEVGTGNGNVGDNIPMHVALLVPKTPTNPFA
jgi:hypothetical protein